MKECNLVSKSGVAAGVICAVVPLAVTGLLLFRFLTDQNAVDEFLIWVVGMVFAVIPMQLAMNHELGRYYRQRIAGGEAPPTHALKLLYGAGHGLLVSVAGTMLALLWAYFFM